MFTVKEILTICHGVLLCGDENVLCSTFTNDTRSLKKGDTYVGIKGEKFDGNSFYQEAFLKGANCVILEKNGKILEKSDKPISLYTQCVYQLLHTISHMFINTISKYCGIDKSSLSEMIFLNACSILIYSQTSQGAVLGALSQTFDKNLYNILKHTYDDNSVCAFDPLCMDTSNGSCCACCYLDEVACEHFNKDLSRRLLYGYKSADGNCDVKGFWEDM